MLFTFHDDKNKERFTFSSVQYIYMADLQGLRHKMIGRYILVEGYALGCKLSYTLPFAGTLSVQSLLLSSSSFFPSPMRCDSMRRNGYFNLHKLWTFCYEIDFGFWLMAISLLILGLYHHHLKNLFCTAQTHITPCIVPDHITSLFIMLHLDQTLNGSSTSASKGEKKK